MSDVPDDFLPYAYPQPNMMVQEGSKVCIIGLKSDAGQKLNETTGTALRFFPQDGRWAVNLDNNGGTFKIHITNLVLHMNRGAPAPICVCLRSNPCWASSTENGRVLVRAGTMGGVPALCIYDNFNHPSFDKDRFYREISMMGIPKEMAASLFDQIRKSP